jgi:hypothetical protein
LLNTYPQNATNLTSSSNKIYSNIHHHNASRTTSAPMPNNQQQQLMQQPQRNVSTAAHTNGLTKNPVIMRDLDKPSGIGTQVRLQSKSVSFA